MLTALRKGLNLEFESAVISRWPDFRVSGSTAVKPSFSNEFLLVSNSYPNIVLAWSIYPNPKANWSSFMISLMWSRSGGFTFESGRRSTFGFGPPDYDFVGALKDALRHRVVDVDMGVLWMLGSSEANRWQKAQFKAFSGDYDYPWFPLHSPIHTFDPSLHGPEDYERLKMAEKDFCIEDGRQIARPVLYEIFEHIDVGVWPVIRDSVIPFAERHPWDG